MDLGVNGCCYLLLQSIAHTPIYCHAGLVFHVYLSLVFTKVIISFRRSDADPGLSVVIRPILINLQVSRRRGICTINREFSSASLEGWALFFPVRY